MRIRVFFLCSLALLLTSCHPGTKVDVVNNAGQTLMVISMNTELEETAYSVADKETVRIQVPYKLQVHRDGTAWDYDLHPKPLPQEFRKRLRGNWYLDTFQIEKDGAIYVLLPDSRPPVTNLPPQPEGFPLRPK